MDVHQPQTFLEGLKRRARRWVELAEDDAPAPAAAPRPAEQARAQTPADAANDDATCRICFSGREEEPTQGRLFSPCLCRGTMSKVHTQCLEDWRRQSVGQRSFFQCDQCGYRYRIGRTQLASIMTRPPALISLTVVLLFVLAFIAGNFAFIFLDATDMLPSTPLWHEWLWYFGAGNAYSANPLYWGDVIGGGVEESLEVFQPPTWLTKGPLGFVIGRISLGSAVLGFLSFIQLAASYALLGHLNALRLFRRRGQDRNGRPGQRSDLFALVVIGMVLFGLVRAFSALYRIVQRGAKLVLTRLGERVLEVR